jgi:hypothetical protein
VEDDHGSFSTTCAEPSHRWLLSLALDGWQPCFLVRLAGPPVGQIQDLLSCTELACMGDLGRLGISALKS